MPIFGIFLGALLRHSPIPVPLKTLFPASSQNASLTLAVTNCKC
jgi:hypothetical protein